MVVALSLLFAPRCIGATAAAEPESEIVAGESLSPALSIPAPLKRSATATKTADRRRITCRRRCRQTTAMTRTSDATLRPEEVRRLRRRGLRHSRSLRSPAGPLLDRVSPARQVQTDDAKCNSKKTACVPAGSPYKQRFEAVAVSQTNDPRDGFISVLFRIPSQTYNANVMMRRATATPMAK